MRAFYETNLALIHNAGFGALALGASRVALRHLRSRDWPARTLIDLGCGSGILAEPIGAAGFDVVGVDLSSPLVSLARQRVPRGRFILGSLYEVELPPAAAVTMIGEVANYLVEGRPEESDLALLFGRIHAALPPGGLFLFDVAVPTCRDAPRQVFTQKAEWTILMETREDPAARLLRRDITTFRRVGDLYRREDETHVLRLWPSQTLERLLGEAGFEVEPLDGYDDVKLPPGLMGYACRRRA
jgi:SAM-dependent methyltransferase